MVTSLRMQATMATFAGFSGGAEAVIGHATELRRMETRMLM